jgi:hypothetical protein
VRPSMHTSDVPTEPRPYRLSTADLRKARALRIWRLTGFDYACNLCGVDVPGLEAEVEVEAELNGYPVVLHFHASCYDAWKAVRARLPREE